MLRQQVEAVGGEEVVKKVDLGPIPLPNVEEPPPASAILRQVPSWMWLDVTSACLFISDVAAVTHLMWPD